MMSKKEMLRSVICDYKAHRDMVKEIHILYKDGTKAGIGNQEVIRMVMNTLISEAERQLLALTWGAEKCPNYEPKTNEKPDKKEGWRKFPDEKPTASGEYLVRGIADRDKKQHHWICLWIGECGVKELENCFFYEGNKFYEVSSGEFEWLDLKEL